MPRKPKALVFDSWAVIAYLEGVPAAEKVADPLLTRTTMAFPYL